MKLSNIETENGIHLALMTERGMVDATAAGCSLSMDDVIKGADREPLCKIEEDSSLPVVENAKYANLVNDNAKIICVGLNYESHVSGIHLQVPDYPVLFSKFSDSLAHNNSVVDLPSWESSYDYEAELVIVVGKEAWGVNEAEAKNCIFGYTCGNDLSCRESQTRTSQWLIGKTMPGFAPCGPCITTADSIDPDEGCAIRSYVNGELRQNGNTSEMVFKCAKVVSYASRYMKLNPGDLIFTGTPTGVALELRNKGKHWLECGDKVDVEIEGIGTLTNTMS